MPFTVKSLPETSLKLSILCLEANNCASGEDSLARHDKCSCSPARIGLIETILCEDRFRKTGNLGSVADEGNCLDFNFTWAWG